MPSSVTTKATYQSFAGPDIFAYFGSVQIANLNAIQYSITREVLPRYTFGDPNPRTFVKGKRAIAGNLTFSQFDKHAILQFAKKLWQDSNGNIVGNIADMIKFFNTNNPGGPNNLPGGVFNNGSSMGMPTAAPSGISNPGIFSIENIASNNAISSDIQNAIQTVGSRNFRYTDQIPPFDITIAFVNEMGATAYMAIQEVWLINEGGSYSIDDLTPDVGFTFVARSVSPLSGNINQTTGNTN